MDQPRRIGKLFWFLVTLIPIVALIWGIISPKDYKAVQGIWQARISQFGAWGPIIFVLLQAAQVIVTPISHYTVGAVGGFLYGPYMGGFLNYIGRIIGHFAAFALARGVGRRFVDRFVDDEAVRKYDHYVAGDKEFGPQVLILFLIYFLPLFPDDEISYLVGLSKMKTRSFVMANVFGHVCGSLSLAYIGSGINTKDTLFWVLFLINLFGFPVLWFLMRRVVKNHPAG